METGRGAPEPEWAQEALARALEVLKVERLAQGLTQMDMAERMGIGYSYVQKIENSGPRYVKKISWGRLTAYAEALGIRFTVERAE